MSRGPRSTRPRVWKRGYCIALVGADGAGKSTLCESLRADCAVPFLLLKMRMHSGSAGVRPMWYRWVRRTVQGMRVIGRAHVALARGEVVVWDRHPEEDRLSGMDGRRILGRGRGWLGRLAPRAHLLVFLDAPVEILHGRRQAQTPEQLRRLQVTYRDWVDARTSITLDATRSPSELSGELAFMLERGR